MQGCRLWLAYLKRLSLSRVILWRIFWITRTLRCVFTNLHHGSPKLTLRSLANSLLKASSNSVSKKIPPWRWTNHMVSSRRSTMCCLTRGATSSKAFGHSSHQASRPVIVISTIMLHKSFVFLRHVWKREHDVRSRYCLLLVLIPGNLCVFAASLRHELREIVLVCVGHGFRLRNQIRYRRESTVLVAPLPSS